jgi:hypothetical protein
LLICFLITTLPAQSGQLIGCICISRIEFDLLRKLRIGRGKILRRMTRLPLRQIGAPHAVMHIGAMRIDLEHTNCSWLSCASASANRAHTELPEPWNKSCMVR